MSDPEPKSHQAVDAALAFGSNLGDRTAHIASGIKSLEHTPGVRVLRVAPTIETPALGDPSSGVDPGGAYLNTVAIVRTTLSARELLETTHAIERQNGRRREGVPPWSPRTLDIDLLLFADAIITLPGLHVPHPRLHSRLFVLQPLAAVAPGWIVPTLGKSVSDLLADLLTAVRARSPIP